MSAVGDETVGLIEISKLIVNVKLLLGLIRPEIAERECRGLEHAVASGILSDRSAGHPWHAPFDLGLATRDGLLDRGDGLFFDERHDLVARLKTILNRRIDNFGHGAPL